MTRLRIGIKRVGNVVFGKVLEQEEELRDYGTLADGGEICYGITSADYPQLLLSRLYVQGRDNQRDNEWFAYAYDDVKKAALVVTDIRMLVAKVNKVAVTPSDTTCGLDIVE